MSRDEDIGPPPGRRSRARWAWAAAGLGAVALAILLPRWVADLRATHGAVAAYTRLIAGANTGDVEAVRRVCTGRYLADHPIVPAREGGMVGFPRNIHKNFRAWREGPDVWLCPTDRIGPVYRFVLEGGEWRFDGPVGVLLSGGRMVVDGGPGVSEESP